MSSGNSAPQGKKYFQGGKHPFFRTSDVGAVHLSENLCDVRDYLNDDGAKGLRIFRKGTVLFPKSGASTFLNHRVMMGFDGYVSSHLATISAGESVYNKYIYYFLNLIDARKIAPNSSYPSLKVASIADIEIPLPPLSEQKKIVARVEKLLAKVKEAKRLRAEARAAAESLLSAELHKIFEEGKKKGWEEKVVDEIADTVQYGYTASARAKGNARLLRITDIQNGAVNWNTVPFCECEDFGKYRLRNGDIVFARTGATVGKSYLINNPPENAVFASYLIRVSMDRKQCSPELLYYFFQSADYWDQITEHAVGGAQPNVNGSKLKQIKIFLPSLPEQKKLVARLDALSAKLKKLGEYQKSADLDLARLEQSILHQAFQGE